MSTQILDGKALAAELKDELKKEIEEFKRETGKFPRLQSIAFGDDAGSKSYVLSQQRTAESLGIMYEIYRLPMSISEKEVIESIRNANADMQIHGIIINKPLPAHIDFKTLIEKIVAPKDVEGMTLANLGRLFLGESKMPPCTPAAAMALLKASGVNLKGLEAVIIGRSEIVGKPMAHLLLKEDVTVTVCHSKTANVQDHLRRADIVVAAIGKPLFLKGEWIKPGVIVIDVGINSLEGKMVGDVDFESARKVAGHITPVPGGVGPVTSVMLMRNVFEAFKHQIRNH